MFLRLDPKSLSLGFSSGDCENELLKKPAIRTTMRTEKDRVARAKGKATDGRDFSARIKLFTTTLFD